MTLIPTWKHWIELGLTEDAIAFDWTARSLASTSKSSKKSKATLIAKANGIWAGDDGLKALELLSKEMGSRIEVKSFVQNGAKLSPKQKICEWSGTAEAIVMFERTLINLTAYTSGIATQAHELVEIVRAKKMKKAPRITPTRKTLPGYRDLAIQSAIIGGAHSHRYNLSGGLLLKENHIAAAGGIKKAIRHAREVVPHLLKIEVEVQNLKELKEAIQAEADVILLDNFHPSQIREAIQLKPKTMIYEVSGGIHSGNLDEYLIEGVDVISIGSITHSVKATDLSLLMDTV